MRKLSVSTIACLLALGVLLLGNSAMQAKDATLTWMMYGTPEQVPVYEELIKDFEAQNPGIHVKMLPLIGSSQYRERLLTLFAGGEAPDVFLTFAQYRDSFIELGMLYDLTKLFDQSTLVSRDMYYPAIRDVFEVDGHIWGTPWGYNSKLWVINSDLREQRGLASPNIDWTTDDFRNYVRRLNDPDKGIVATDAASSLSLSAGNLGWAYNFTGHYWIDPKTEEVHVNDPGMLDMLNFWLDLQDTYKGASGYTVPRPPSGVRGGSIAMYETWSTEPHYLSVLAAAGQWDWELASFPAGPAGNTHFAQGHLWSIPADHPNPEVAWKFVEYLGSRRAEEMWAQTGRTPPQIHDIELWNTFFKDVPAKKRYDAIAFILNDLYAAGRAKSFTYWPEFAEMESLMKSLVSRVMRGQEAPGNALANLATQYQIILDEN